MVPINLDLKDLGPQTFRSLDILDKEEGKELRTKANEGRNCTLARMFGIVHLGPFIILFENVLEFFAYATFPNPHFCIQQFNFLDICLISILLFRYLVSVHFCIFIGILVNDLFWSYYFGPSTFWSLDI